MPLVLVGIFMVGLCSAAWASELIPQLRLWYRRRRQVAERMGPRVKTTISMREEEPNERFENE